MIGGILRFLIRGPGTLRPLAARLAVIALAVAGAAMLAWSAVLHLELWADGYRDIPSIGPLFLAAGIADIALALAAVVLPRLVVLLAGAGSLLATAGGLLLSVHLGLFGYRESLAVPYATLSLYVELTGAAVLLLGAATVAAAPVRRDGPGQPANPCRASSRT